MSQPSNTIQQVQGFTMTATYGGIANADKVKGWPAMDDEIGNLFMMLVDNGTALSQTSRKGKNQIMTRNFRIDHQGQSFEKTCANTQMQKGGEVDYVRKKGESTSLTEVHVVWAAFNAPRIGEALRIAHNYSFSTKLKVKIETVAVITVTPPPRQWASYCGDCGARLGNSIPNSYAKCPLCNAEVGSNFSYRG